MKRRLLTFIDMLRGADLPITISETLDALAAVRVIGIERAGFHDGLAATLLKDEADRPTSTRSLIVASRWLEDA